MFVGRAPDVCGLYRYGPSLVMLAAYVGWLFHCSPNPEHINTRGPREVMAKIKSNSSPSRLQNQGTLFKRTSSRWP